MIVGDLEIRLRADIARLQADMTQARRTVTETQDRINAAANAMKTALAGIGIGAGLAEIIKMADEYAKFTAQLRLASTSVADYAASYEAVKRIAKTSQQDLASTGVLYARIANGTRELGTTQKQVYAAARRWPRAASVMVYSVPACSSITVTPSIEPGMVLSILIFMVVLIGFSCWHVDALGGQALADLSAHGGDGGVGLGIECWPHVWARLGARVAWPACAARALAIIAVAMLVIITFFITCLSDC